MASPPEPAQQTADRERARPLISVCIANFNGMGFIDDCLRSVRAQVGGLAVEIIVHDDASTDGSAAYIRAHYPDVVLLEGAANAGFCVSNNRMVDRARGEYILLLNNDAELFPDALAALNAEAGRAGKPAILGLPQYDHETGRLIDIGSLCDPFLNPVPNFDAVRGEVAMVSGACLWIPRGLWDELGGFPEWFNTLAEDAYLCLRARVEGYSVRALCTSGFRHWVGKSIGGGRVTAQNRLSTSRKRRARSERNKSFVMVLTYPAPLLLILFPLHLGLLLIEGLVLALLKRDGRIFSEIYWDCLKGLWQERGRVFRLRRKIQACRRANLASFLSVFGWIPHKLRMLFRHGLPHLQ